MRVEKDGNSYDFVFDIDKVFQAEEEDPEFSIFSLLERLDRKRLTDIDRLLGFFGWSLKDLLSSGLTIEDMVSGVTGALEEAGFLSAEQ